jgi:GNAT superfamily N-acetyltransferase
MEKEKEAFNSIQIEQIFPSLTWRIRHQTMYPDQEFNFVKLKNDFDGLHFGLYLNHNLTGVVSLFIDGENAQFRKLAILPDYQKQGLGFKLMEYLIDFCKIQNIKHLYCSARATAIPFYQKLGFEPEGNPYTRNQINYINMCLIMV